jgi:hypothetical protein
MAERTTYLVNKANIKDDDGNKRCHGETARLGPKLAKRYNDLGFLRPYIPDVDVDDEDDNVDPPNPNGTRPPLSNNL